MKIRNKAQLREHHLRLAEHHSAEADPHLREAEACRRSADPEIRRRSANAQYFADCHLDKARRHLISATHLTDYAEAHIDSVNDRAADQLEAFFKEKEPAPVPLMPRLSRVTTRDLVKAIGLHLASEQAA